jgi:hypothetical protein
MSESLLATYFVGVASFLLDGLCAVVVRFLHTNKE